MFRLLKQRKPIRDHFRQQRQDFKELKGRLVVRRNPDNGGAVSSGAGGRNSADQRKPEGEEKADGETDFSASQET
ncbi:hypothetical protein NDU88_001660 [Pleurodeles waltl]|uniref:Uncharacterized protein n=1 Tax=Pleurodeles waltl TaxID=8319 RepID=A0AAV7W0M4_PLEWA|nr:hypothetical protein NDU88_001660 [Pleurodeles waltl]